jgi:hypothetical protein
MTHLTPSVLFGHNLKKLWFQDFSSKVRGLRTLLFGEAILLTAGNVNRVWNSPGCSADHTRAATHREAEILNKHKLHTCDQITKPL